MGKSKLNSCVFLSFVCLLVCEFKEEKKISKGKPLITVRECVCVFFFSCAFADRQRTATFSVVYFPFSIVFEYTLLRF